MRDCQPATPSWLSEHISVAINNNKIKLSVAARANGNCQNSMLANHKQCFAKVAFYLERHRKRWAVGTAFVTLKCGWLGRLQTCYQEWNVDILLILSKLLRMQCKWTFTKRFTHSIAQEKYPVAGQQSQKCASLAVIARYIKIIYTGYLQIFKAGYFFSKKRGHGL